MKGCLLDMKQWFRLTILALLVFALAACSSAPQEQAAPIDPNANKLLFVGGSGTDPFLIQKFKDMGLEVTVKSDYDLKTEDADNVGVIYISHTVVKKAITGKLLNVDKPIIFSNSKIAIIHRLTKDGSDGTVVNENAIKSIDIVAEHPIMEGFSGSIDVYNKTSNAAWAKPTGEATVLATLPGDKEKPAIFVYEKGAKNSDGQPVAARQAFFYHFYQSDREMSEDGVKLLKQMVEWAVGKR